MAFKWYIINTLSGSEQKIVKAIREAAEQKKLADKFDQIIVPARNVNEIRKGKKVVAEKKFFPGYILIKMELNDLTWNVVKNVPKVAGLLGSAGKPTPVRESEVLEVIKQIEEVESNDVVEIVYQAGETIKICDGPFETFTGVIEEVDSEKKRLKVSVSIFGRSTPVELEFNQIEKI